MRRMMSVLVAGALCALAGPALAHAMLERTTPAVGGAVAASPAEIRLQFSEGVAPALSRVTVRDAAGGAVALGPLRIAPNAARILIAPVRAALSAGTYRVAWRAVSVDSHVTNGAFTFRVGR